MATSTITGTILDPTGTAVASVPVTCRLMPTGGFRTATGSEVARVATTTTNASGVYSFVLERNSGIEPANTYYELVEEIPVARGGRRVWNIQVGASNQTVLAALITPLPTASNSAYLTQAAADARYQALGGLSSSSPNTIEPDDAASAGVSTSASRSDHEHGIVAAAPVDTGDANAEGAATSFARSNHVHKGVVANEAWTSFTPTLANITLGNGTLVASYHRLGRTIHYRVKLTFGTTSAMGTNPTITLPVAASATYGAETDTLGMMQIADSGTADFAGIARLVNTTTVRLMVLGVAGTYANHIGFTALVPMTWTTADSFSVYGTYEAAS